MQSDSPTTYLVGHGTDNPGSVERQASLSSLVRFEVWWRGGLLRPTWAALCGALASGTLNFSTDSLLHLALLLFLVDVVWGGLWLAVAKADWTTPLHHWQNWRVGEPVRLLPYTSPHGPAGRLALTFGQLRSWWADLVRPALGPTVSGLAVLLPVALVVAAVLGVRPLLVTLTAISLLQIVFIRTLGSAHPIPGAQALIEIALPWLAGHVLFAPLTLASTILALAYGVSYAGALRLLQGWPGLVRWNIGQITAVIVLVTVRQPIAAGIVGLLFIGQAIAQPGLFDEETEEIKPATAARFVRMGRYVVMAAMLVAALGIRAAYLKDAAVPGGGG